MMNRQLDTRTLYHQFVDLAAWVGEAADLRDDGANVRKQSDDNSGPPCLPAIVRGSLKDQVHALTGQRQLR